jgi:hypothetical protein
LLLGVLSPEERAQIVREKALIRQEARLRYLYPARFAAKGAQPRADDAEAMRFLDALILDMKLHPEEYRHLQEQPQPKPRPLPAKKAKPAAL